MEIAARKYLEHALMFEDPKGMGWLIHLRNSYPTSWKLRPHFLWKLQHEKAIEEPRDDDPERMHIMLGSRFYPLTVAVISFMLGDTGYEGTYHLNTF